MKHAFLLSIVVIVFCGATRPVRGDILWYNGDGSGQNSLRNQVNSGGEGARTFDDFTVDAPLGWDVSYVWSNNLLAKNFFGDTPNVSSASWSIRSDMSEGNPGTVVAEGFGAATKVATNRFVNVFYEEFTITVSGLSVHLDPGTYWLQVSPVVGEAYNSVTTGANSVGSPAGNNGNSFWDRPSSDDIYVARTEDFSMGVGGLVSVPEPSTFVLWSLFSTVALVTAWWRRRGAVAGKE